MTESPAQGQVAGREGSNEQATRGTAPPLSPSPAKEEIADTVTETGTEPGAAKPPWFVDPARLDVVDSTNRYLTARAVEGAPEGLSVVADRQTAGRGRLERSWIDVPGGSLLCSMLFRPVMEMDRWFLVSMLVALAGLDACADVAGVDASCKWPNDLVVDGRKIGGILAEVVRPPASPAAGSGPGLVVGIGINCNWGDAWDDSPLGPSLPATSLDRVAGRPVDREAVTLRLLERVAQRYSALTGRAGWTDAAGTADSEAAGGPSADPPTPMPSATGPPTPMPRGRRPPNPMRSQPPAGVAAAGRGAGTVPHGGVPQEARHAGQGRPGRARRRSLQRPRP